MGPELLAGLLGAAGVGGGPGETQSSQCVHNRGHCVYSLKEKPSRLSCLGLPPQPVVASEGFVFQNTKKACLQIKYKEGLSCVTVWDPETRHPRSSQNLPGT